MHSMVSAMPLLEPLKPNVPETTIHSVSTARPTTM